MRAACTANLIFIDYLILILITEDNKLEVVFNALFSILLQINSFEIGKSTSSLSVGTYRSCASHSFIRERKHAQFVCGTVTVRDPWKENVCRWKPLA
jgi:hypothetical protein